MAQYEDITIDQGTDFAIELHLADKNGATKDLTNHLVNAKIKKPTTVILLILMILIL